MSVNRIAYCSFHDDCYHIDGPAKAAYEAAVEALVRMLNAPTPGATRQARAALRRLRETEVVSHA